MAKLAFQYLSEDDIRNLVRHPDEEVRAVAAQRICHKVRSALLTGAERKFAHKLLEHMVQDTAEMVRRALAITLKNSPELPRDIAMTLAEDIENIAIPVLAHSPVFTDEDLIEILRSRAAAKVLAVAKRPNVSGNVVRAIIRFGDGQAAAELAANDGALIDEHSANEMLELYHDNDLIKESFIARRDLPPRIAEKLITMVTEEAAILISKRHSVPVDIAIDLAERTRERATIDYIDQSWLSKDIKTFTRELYQNGRLTPSMILRAVCAGQIRFMEHALAVLSGVSHAKAALMVHDGGPFGLKALCARAGLSDATTHVIRAACIIYRDLELSNTCHDKSEFQARMIERVLTLPIPLPDTEQAYFLEKLDALDSEAA